VTALVTGGSGVVGGAVIRALLHDGGAVRALSRSEPASRVVTGLGASSVAGDLLDIDALVDAMAGCDVVYHVGGVNAMCLRDPQPMYAANVDGTRAVLEAAQRSGVRRVVYTSSAIVLGERNGTVGSESSPHRGSFHSHYERSKYEAELIALSGQWDVEVVAVCPSSVQGPGRATGTGKLILDVIRGKLPFLVDVPISIVDIDDCARGHLLAAEHGEPGQRYVLNGFTMTAPDAMAKVQEIIGRPLRVQYLPKRLVRAMGPVLDVVNRVKQVPFCAEMITVMTHGHTYDGSRAERDLGLEYRPAEDTLRRTIDWFVSEGLLEG
jgi:dihydroflavonol-4-reductase